MKRVLKSFFISGLLLTLVSTGCRNNAPETESGDFQLFYHVPGSCPLYYLNTLDTHLSHIPTETSALKLESFLKNSPDAARVKLSFSKTGKVIQHTCGDREANPQLHDFIEIEIFSITKF